MVYSPGIDWAERIMYDFPEAEWGIDEEIYDADYPDLEIKEYCAFVDDGYLPNCYGSYNAAAKAIYDYLKEGE